MKIIKGNINMKLKRYNLYTFTKSRLIWTETENVKQAINNFNRKLNIDHNGYNHPELEYVFNPMRVVTVDKSDDELGNRSDDEKIISFNCNKLENLILKEFD
jgi:hypothetical protein